MGPRHLPEVATSPGGRGSNTSFSGRLLFFSPKPLTWQEAGRNPAEGARIFSAIPDWSKGAWAGIHGQGGAQGRGTLKPGEKNWKPNAEQSPVLEQKEESERYRRSHLYVSCPFLPLSVCDVEGRAFVLKLSSCIAHQGIGRVRAGWAMGMAIHDGERTGRRIIWLAMIDERKGGVARRILPASTSPIRCKPKIVGWGRRFWPGKASCGFELRGSRYTRATSWWVRPPEPRRFRSENPPGFEGSCGHSVLPRKKA